MVSLHYFFLFCNCSLPHQQPTTISIGSGGQQPYVTSSAAAQSTQQALQGLGSASQQPNLGFPSFLGPGVASAQASLGLPTVNLAANNLPSSPYIFRSGSNQSDPRQQLPSGADEFEQPFAARLRSEEGNARLEEEEQEEDDDGEEEGKGVAELVREMEASHLRLPGGYQQPPVGAYHLAPLPSGSFQSGPSSYQLSPAAYHPGPSSHQSNPAAYQLSPTSYHPSSATHQGSSESYQPLSPPSYQPPPSISKHQQQEDIKVIHFGVV